MTERNRSKCHCCAVFHPIKKMFFNKNNHAMGIMAIVNFSNLVLVTVKAVVAYNTGSFSIANSTLETFGDVFVGFLLLVQRAQAHIQNDSRYPRGRSTEALSNVVASVVMLVLAGVNAVLNIDRFVANKFDPHLELEHIGVIAFNIVLKITLFFVCFVRRDVDQVKVLLKDQGVDVITNTTAVLFAILTKYLHKNWDILGAVIIFATICRNWTPILFTNCSRIHGVVPKQKKIDMIKKAIDQSKLVSTVHDIIVYHRGQDVIVELYADLYDSKSPNKEIARRKLVKHLEEVDCVDIAYVFHTLSEAVIVQKCEEHQKSNVKETDRFLPNKGY